MIIKKVIVLFICLCVLFNSFAFVSVGAEKYTN